MFITTIQHISDEGSGHEARVIQFTSKCDYFDQLWSTLALTFDGFEEKWFETLRQFDDAY